MTSNIYQFNLKQSISAILILLLTACASSPQQFASKTSPDAIEQSLALFSSNPGHGLPDKWEPLILMRKKPVTQYNLVTDPALQRTVLHAYADKASSGLRHVVDIDPRQQPWLSWSWKIASLINTADNTRRETEDSPVRIVLAFDGDKSKLSFIDSILFDTVKLVSGHEFPYATLMYIWENKAPEETVIPNTRTGRIQMIVAESGPDNVGKWVSYERNIVDDYIKVFGEKPGHLIAIGVLTDTDNTEQQVEAWYGDILLQHTPHMH